MNLPALWVWEIIDELVYQFYTNCQWRFKLKSQDPEFQELMKHDDFYCLDTMMDLLQKKDSDQSNLSLIDLYKLAGLVKLFTMKG